MFRVLGWTNARFHDFSSTTQVEELRNRDDSSEGRIGNPFVRGSGLEIPVRESRVAYVFGIPWVGSASPEQVAVEDFYLQRDQEGRKHPRLASTILNTA